MAGDKFVCKVCHRARDQAGANVQESVQLGSGVCLKGQNILLFCGYAERMWKWKLKTLVQCSMNGFASKGAIVNILYYYYYYYLCLECDVLDESSESHQAT